MYQNKEGNPTAISVIIVFYCCSYFKMLRVRARERERENTGKEK